MKFGDSGDNIRSLQTALTRVGFPVTIDGQFGAHTEAAVKALQAAGGLTVDGVVGHDTLVQLDKLEAALPKVPVSSSSEVKGCDVSNWQKHTNWPELAKDGFKFVVIKATEAVSVFNPLFPGDFAAAKANGIYRGAYHFFRAQYDARTQANHFLQRVGPLYPSDKVMLDLETMDGMTPQVVVAGALAWLNQVRSVTKKTPILYTMPNQMQLLGHPPAFAEFPLCLAAPGHTLQNVRVPAPWTKVTILQTSFTGRDPAIEGNLDIDAFNGTLTQLDQFFKESV